LDRTDSDTKLLIADLERWRDRIIEAIDRGYAERENGDHVELDEKTGIDTLGNMVEPSDLSVNRKFYGQLHNGGHDIISHVHDPDSKYLEDYSVMGDVTTAVRDPIFYRWHGFIDDIFQRHKESLRMYSSDDLSSAGMTVKSFSVKMVGGSDVKPNQLETFWTKTTVDLQAGMDFAEGNSIYAEFTHLDHQPFNYTINLDNNTGIFKKAIFRIFLGAKKDQNGTTYTLNNQRRLMIELDKWTAIVQTGPNTVVRSSLESNVTVPKHRTFRPVKIPENVEEPRYRFCSCGWPQHMLLPKGTLNGLDFDLFVMVSWVVKDDKANITGDG
jgi:tyrosinase